MFEKAIVMAVLILVVTTALMLVVSGFSQRKSDTLPPGRWTLSAIRISAQRMSLSLSR